MTADDRLEPRVLVLVDEENAKVPVALTVEGVEEPIERLDPVDGRDDEVKAGKRSGRDHSATVAFFEDFGAE